MIRGHRSPVGGFELLRFMLGSTPAAVDPQFVRAVIRGPIEPSRGVASDILPGTVRFDGHVVPVLSLARLAGSPEPVPTCSASVLVTRLNRQWVGCLVDQLNQGTARALGPVTRPPPSILEAAPMISGLVPTAEGLLMVLDLRALLRPFSCLLRQTDNSDNRHPALDAVP